MSKWNTGGHYIVKVRDDSISSANLKSVFVSFNLELNVPLILTITTIVQS